MYKEILALGDHEMYGLFCGPGARRQAQAMSPLPKLPPEEALQLDADWSTEDWDTLDAIRKAAKRGSERHPSANESQSAPPVIGPRVTTAGNTGNRTTDTRVPKSVDDVENCNGFRPRHAKTQGVRGTCV